MLNVVIRYAALNPEHSLVQPFMKEFKDNRNLQYRFNKEFVAVFDKVVKEETLRQEQTQKAKEEASALSVQSNVLLFDRANGANSGSHLSIGPVGASSLSHLRAEDKAGVLALSDSQEAASSSKRLNT